MARADDPTTYALLGRHLAGLAGEVTEVTLTFAEQVPSGCSDMPHQLARERRVVIVLDAGDSTGAIQASASDPNHWDLVDRNSAADGR